MEKQSDIVQEVFFIPESRHIHHEIKSGGGKPTYMKPKFSVFCGYLSDIYNRVMLRTSDLSFTGEYLNLKETHMITQKQFMKDMKEGEFGAIVVHHNKLSRRKPLCTYYLKYSCKPNKKVVYTK